MLGNLELGIAMWKLLYTKRAQKDALRVAQAGLRPKAEALLSLIQEDPYQMPPALEKIKGVEETYSRRLNIQHRLVYQVLKEEKIILIRMMFRHYD